MVETAQSTMFMRGLLWGAEAGSDRSRSGSESRAAAGGSR